MYSVSTYTDCPNPQYYFYSCSFTTITNCSHDYDVAVQCYTSKLIYVYYKTLNINSHYN